MAKYKNFKVKDIFEVSGTKSLDAGNLVFQEEGINFIGRTKVNNGLQGKISHRGFDPNEPHTITATVIGNYKYVKYQSEPYYTSQNINKLVPKYSFNKYVMIYLVTHIQKFVSLYNGQQSGYKLPELENHEILLPVKEDNHLDLEKMSEVIQETKKRQLKEISLLLESKGFDFESDVTNEDQTILREYTNSTKMMIKVGCLFEILSTKKKFNAKDVKICSNGYPYVVRMSTNNGIRGYLQEDKEDLNEGNTLSFGQDTATIFYQSEPYFTGDKIKVMKPLFNNFDSYIALYLITAMKKSFSTFSWGTSSFNVNILKNVEICVPMKAENKIPNFELMRAYVKVVEKIKLKNILEIIAK